MTKYIANKLNVNLDEAKKIQKDYFDKYNTTVNGMINNHIPEVEEDGKKVQ